MSEDPSVVQVRGLTKRFNGLTAVDNIDFDLRPHCTTALLGSNGAGKTTTISMLLGLLLPTNGTIRIFGQNLISDRFKILPRINISSPYIDLPQRLTVRQNLTVYSRLYKVPSSKERIAKLSKDLELTEFIDRQVRKLSSGQKTRVSLAKALINEPELLLLDEPTASLDPETAMWVRDYLRKYQERRNTAILLASHNMLEVERMCQHVYIMNKGRIVEQGSPTELISRHEKQDLEEVFLKIARN
ncbi:MAG: ABC transporter ATP-binding protein [Opitutae bacterium]|jgi:ABC-2 type transport system ATP-binding protein|nr:ABC transporter ATP-binding protein [Opitutae bacterium]MBT5378519.1 ABC transporter ATP-binding protein [Opitutae bacterium]MBT5689928.1 ABC transporter ATP-binding protein [Opitutae bacterium]MBT6461574.1 ABC transporter ATP-binding protein [Opitutae bacterium]MBT7853747.1 ABC transporter ATP-binding protein [Opitutae bacterium]